MTHRFYPLRRGARTLGVAGALVVACGGKELPPADAGPLDCAWLTGPNCWSEAMANVASNCGEPIGGFAGNFSADRRTCTSADGHTVVSFATPVPNQPGHYLLNFQIARDGVPCFTATQTDDGVSTLTMPTGTVTLTQADTWLAVRCPDGSTFVQTATDPNCSAQPPAWFSEWIEPNDTFGVDVSGAGLLPQPLVVYCEQ